MKRRIAGIAALAAAVALALGLPSVGVPARPGDAHGPLCSDIRLTADYLGTAGDAATVSGNLFTPQGPSCQGGVYTVYVYDASGTTLLGTQQFIGDDSNDAFGYSISITNAPSSVCVYGTSEIRGRIADTAPDGACSGAGEPVLLNGGTGASGFG